MCPLVGGDNLAATFSPELADLTIYAIDVAAGEKIPRKALGDKERAMAWLEKGYEDRFNPGVLLRPGFDPLRSDPRFKDLVHRIGLPR